MILLQSHISILINLVLQKYHFDATSICILWNNDFPFTLHQQSSEEYPVIANIHMSAFKRDDLIDSARFDLLTPFEKLLTDFIEFTHCESFLAFEEEIAVFARAFMKSVVHSKWRSLKNKFLFIYTRDKINTTADFDYIFFKDLSNILLMEVVNETYFNLKTTKFVGSRKDHPEQLIPLDNYNGETNSFTTENNLYPDKIMDLMGRELIVGAFAYEPFSVLRNGNITNVMNVENGNEDPSRRLLFDGTDAQIVFQLCALYNCTVQVDSSQIDWGYVHDNYTGEGILGLIFDRKVDIGMLAMYMWYESYRYLEMSEITSRSGITCLVPAPRRIMGWLIPLRQFHWLLWLGIVGCLTLESIGLFVTHSCDQGETGFWIKSVCFGYVTSLKLFVNQGCRYLPSSVSFRIVLFSCYMIDIIITSIYSGGLASILTLPSLGEAADSVERLVTHNLIWSATSYVWILTINESDQEMTKRLLKNFRVFSPAVINENPEFAKTIGYITERLEFGHFAIPQYLSRSLLDRLKIMVDDIYYQYCVALVPRSWPLLNKLNNLILMMRSSGLIQPLEWEVVAKYANVNLQRQVGASVKPNFDDVGPVKLDIDNFIGIMAILIVGTVISILVFIGEILHFQYKLRESKKNVLNK